jgi:hypothetical protein
MIRPDLLEKDPEFCGAIRRAVAIRNLDRLKRIEKGEPGWQGTASAMERLYPKVRSTNG